MNEIELPKPDGVVYFDEILGTKKHITSAPTFTPRTFYEAIQFYDDATNRRIYLYINGSWRYVALT